MLKVYVKRRGALLGVGIWEETFLIEPNSGRHVSRSTKFAWIPMP